MRSLSTLTAAMLIGAMIVTAPSAVAAGVSPPVADCSAHNRLTRHYSDAELQTALNTMPSDIREYTDCYDVIQGQLLAQLGKTKATGSADGGSGGSFLPTPVVVAIVVLALAAAILGALALARRRPPGS